jgi:CHAD domain-containing protein
MNLDPRIERGAASLGGDWPQQFQSWRKLLVDCSRKPSKGLVHSLRVQTLRLMSGVDQWRRTQPAGAQANEVLRRWAKQAKKLRRVLSDVREIDVHLAKLAGLKASLAAPRGYQPRSNRLPLRQLEALRRTLKQERRSAQKRLAADIEGRLVRIDQVSAEVEPLLSRGLSLQQVPDRSLALFEMFHSIARQFPALDAACLHDFRKRIKSVRYQAELFARADAKVRKLAVALKAMQTATGEWHDWQVLGTLAARRFHDHTNDGGLGELLGTLAEESLERALATCERQIALNGPRESPADASPLRLVEKIPVKRAEAWGGSMAEYVA